MVRFTASFYIDFMLEMRKIICSAVNELLRFDVFSNISEYIDSTLLAMVPFDFAYRIT